MDCYRSILLLILPFINTVVLAQTNSAPIFDCLLVPSQVEIISSTESSIIEKILVKEGDNVEQNSPVILLESSVERVLVNLAAIKKTSTIEILASKKNLELAEARHNRMIKLKKDKVISQDETEDAIAQLNNAKLNYEQALLNRKLAVKDYEKAAAILNKKTIRSKIKGIVTDIYLHIGESPKGNQILKIIDIDPLKIKVIMPSHYFGKIKKGIFAQVKTEQNPEKDLKAKVINVDKNIDPESGTFFVTLEIDNKQLNIPSGQKCLIQFESLLAAPLVKKRIEDITQE